MPSVFAFGLQNSPLLFTPSIKSMPYFKSELLTIERSI